MDSDVGGGGGPWEGGEKEEEAEEDEKVYASHNDNVIFLVDARKAMHEKMDDQQVCSVLRNDWL
jgi:predicted GTPase